MTITDIVKSLIKLVDWLVGQLEEYKEREKLISTETIKNFEDRKKTDPQSIPITISNHSDADIEIKICPETGRLRMNFIGGGGAGEPRAHIGPHTCEADMIEGGGSPTSLYCKHCGRQMTGGMGSSGGAGDYQTFKSSGEWQKPEQEEEKNPAFDNYTMDRIREKCPQLPSDGEDEEVEDDIKGSPMASHLLYASIQSNLTDYHGIVSARMSLLSADVSSKLGILQRQIKRQLHELYASLKEENNGNKKD